MSDKIISVDLDDERIGKIADVISNKTCKKILDVLAEKEMSAGEISEELKIPLNTAGYNLEKLSDAGLIEKKKEFLWSEKGKRIVKYRVANKKIVISPVKRIKGLLSTLIISGLIGVGLKVWSGSKVMQAGSAESVADKAVESASSASSASSELVAKTPEAVASATGNVIQVGDPAFWFMTGVIVALVIIVLFNWRKIWK
ncbi:MAG: helix-turn-helix domain-containing protein [Nanoarchaeota archaeon]